MSPVDQPSSDSDYDNMTTNDYIELVKRLGEESAIRGDIFIYACSSCRYETNLQRVLETECGHGICRKCAHGAKECPFCSVPTSFTPIIGDEDRSRDCGICLVDHPYERMIFSGCGHSICSGCALQMDETALRLNLPISCPFCRCKSTCVELKEEAEEPEMSPIPAPLPVASPPPPLPSPPKVEQVEKKNSSRKRSNTSEYPTSESNKRSRIE